MKFDWEIETRLGLRRNRISQPLKLAIILIAPLYRKLVILKEYPLLRSLFHSRWVFDLAVAFYRTSALCEAERDVFNSVSILPADLLQVSVKAILSTAVLCCCWNLGKQGLLLGF